MKEAISLRACALTVLALASLPVMAESVNVAVVGTITPSACTPVLGGGGTIDYGSISPDTLSATAYTVLPIKSLPINITCDAPAKIAIRAINGRPESVAGASEGTVGYAISPVDLMGVSANGMRVAGLGKSGGQRIGGYTSNILRSSVLVDDVVADTISRDGTNGAWTGARGAAIGGPPLFHFTQSQHISWAATGTLEPIAFTTLTALIRVQPYLNKTSELTVDKPVTLDGLTTIELVYL